jgi:hypothetical protein
MTITFDGIAITNHSPPKIERTAYAFKAEIVGMTDDLSDISNLRAKAGPSKAKRLVSGYTKIQTLGTKGSLVIDTETITNCVIMDEIKEEPVPGTNGQWVKYTVKLEQETI